MTEDDLDTLFAQARATSPAPSSALTARVLADAADLQARPADLPQKARPRSGVWAALARAFGGAGALAGMATATIAGLYLGFAQPLGEGVIVSVLGGELASIDMMPGIDALLDEAP